MASIEVKEYIDVGTGGPIDTVRYQFAKDAEFNLMIDDITLVKTELLASGVPLENVENKLLKCHSPLPKRSEDGVGFYMDLENLHTRYMLTANGHSSDWFVCDSVSQVNDVPVEIVDGDDKRSYSTSTKLGWNDDNS